MTDRESFLERRKSGIGGSDVAAILGLSKWKTAYQVWQDKTGRANPTPENNAQHFGIVLEQTVADEFVRVTGKAVQRRNDMFRMKEHPELVANIDRYIVGGGVLECKTTSAFALKDWGESGSDDIPDYYMTQVQHYMHVTGYRDNPSYLAVLIGGSDFRHYRIEYDRDLAEFQAEQCISFWRDNVLTDIPPMVTIRDNLAEIYPGKSGELYTATEDDVKLLTEYNEIAKCAGNLKNRKEELAAKIKLMAGNAESIVGTDGKVLATLKRSKDSTADIVDWEQLARTLLPETELNGETLKAFTRYGVVTRPGSRMLKVK